MTTFKNTQFNSLKDLLICMNAITTTVDKEYHQKNMVFHGLTYDNIFIDSDDCKNIQLIDNGTSAAIGVQPPRRVVNPCCALEVYLACTTYKDDYSDTHQNSVDRINFNSDYCSIGKLFFYKLMGRLPNMTKGECWSTSSYDFQSEKCIFNVDIDNTLSMMLTKFFQKTLPRANNRYQTFIEINQALNEMLDYIDNL